MSLNDVPPKAPNIRQAGYQGSVQVQQALDSLTRPVNAALAFLNAVFTGNAGSPSASLVNLTLSGALSAASATFAGIVAATTITVLNALHGNWSWTTDGSGNLVLTGNGQSIFYTAPGFFLQNNKPSGSVFLTVTNQSATSSIAGLDVATGAHEYLLYLDAFGDFILAQDQTAGGAVRVFVDSSGILHTRNGITIDSGALVTANGIKSVVGPIIYWNTAYPGGVVSGIIPIVNSGTAASVPWVWKAPFAGSVLGISVNNQPANGALGMTITANGSTAIVNNVTIIGSATANGAVTFTKGSHAFNAGDVLTATFNATAGNVAIQAHVVVEMDA